MENWYKHRINYFARVYEAMNLFIGIMNIIIIAYDHYKNIYFTLKYLAVTLEMEAAFAFRIDDASCAVTQF